MTISRTGFTGDLGYELFVPARAGAQSLWDRLVAAGRTHGIRAIGYTALNRARIEAGLIVANADFTTAEPTAFVISLIVIGAIVMPVAVPLIVMLKEPMGVDVMVFTFNVELAAVVVFGENAAEAPAGRPVALSVTLSAKLSRLILIV